MDNWLTCKELKLQSLEENISENLSDPRFTCFLTRIQKAQTIK